MDLTLSMALEHYDRTAPFFEGLVDVPGTSLQVFHVGQSVPGRDGDKRHNRMLREREFDIAEVSLSSYLMAKDRGLPFTAVPVFPRRLFSQSQMWCRVDAGIRTPADLAGRRVGLNTFQTTMSVLAKGDLKHSYGVDWKSIHWVLARTETMDFTPTRGVKLERVPTGSALQDLLLDGDIDAVIMPHPPPAILNSPGRITRLFPDPETEEQDYLQRVGYYPIMHVIALAGDALEHHPSLPRDCMAAFDQAWEICRQRWDDPNWSYLAWGRHAFEHERRLGEDMWDNGLERNRANLEWFVEQSRDQGLITRRLSLDALFHPATLET